MSVEVRAIAPDELVRWVQTMHVAFHIDRSAEEDATFRREVLGQDFSRTLAAFDDTHLAGTLFSFAAELSLPGGSVVPSDAISAVSVLPTHRRRGLLSRMIEVDLRAARERGDPAAILIAAEYPIYGRFGFGPATDRVDYTVQTPAARFTAASTSPVELVEPSRLRELAPPMFDRFRRNRPGQIDREAWFWDMRLWLRPAPWARYDRPPRCAMVLDADGELQGYATYRVEPAGERHLPQARLEIFELMALTAEAYHALWRYCCEVDLVREVTASLRSVDEPLPWLLDNPRAALEAFRTDFLWVRPLDVTALLGAREYLAEGQLVLDIIDEAGLSGGRFDLEAGPDGATCRSTTRPADLSMDVRTLGAILLGGVSLHALADARQLDTHRPHALQTGERLFRWPVAPWCSTFF